MAGYDFDKYGNLRAISRVVNGVDMELLYSIDGKFKQLMVVPFGEEFGINRFDYASENPDVAYVVSNLNTDKIQIQRYDLRANAVLETMYSDDTYDVESFSMSSFDSQKGVRFIVSRLGCSWEPEFGPSYPLTPSTV